MTPSKTTPRKPVRPPSVRARAAIDSVRLVQGKKPHPVLGLGLWAFGRWKQEDEARTKATLGRAYEHGVRWFDTAEVYGNGRSERLLGDVLARAVGGAPDVYVTTKVSWEHLRPAQVRASLINSLERLGRVSVDEYLVHAPDPHVPLSDTMPVLEALWKEGRIGVVGVSNFGVEELEEAAKHLSEARIAVNQVRYNLFDRDDADPIREYCQKHQILVEAYSPLARGLLAGRYLDGGKVPTEIKRYAHRMFEPNRLPDILTRGRALLALAKESHVPLASIALHWLADQGAAPLVGASRPDQVDENLAAWAVHPPARVLDRADAIARGDRA